MAAGPAEAEPTAVAVQLMLPVAKESKREACESGPCRDFATFGQATAPNGGARGIYDGGSGLFRHDLRDLGYSGLRCGQQFRVCNSALRFPAAPRRTDSGPRLGNGRRRNGKLYVFVVGAGKPVQHGRERHSGISMGLVRKSHGPQAQDGGRRLAEDPWAQDAHIGGQHTACGLKPDGAVFDAFGTGHVRAEVGKVAGIGKAEGLGQDVCHILDFTGMSAVERGWGAV